MMIQAFLNFKKRNIHDNLLRLFRQPQKHLSAHMTHFQDIMGSTEILPPTLHSVVVDLLMFYLQVLFIFSNVAIDW